MNDPLPPWEATPGRCGACTKFKRDFGGSTGKVYGHCEVKPRAGSLTSTDFKCDVYVQLEALGGAGGGAARREPPARRPSVNPFEVTVETPHRPPKPRPAPPPPKVTVNRRREIEDSEPVELGGSEMDRGTLRRIVQEAIEDSLGIGEVELLERFVGGTVVIRPGTPGTQDKEIPSDGLMTKVVAVRENLRVLEAKLNAHPKLDDADRVQLQQYITRCYGSLTTFNALFRNRDDWFKGVGKNG